MLYTVLSDTLGARVSLTFQTCFNFTLWIVFDLCVCVYWGGGDGSVQNAFILKIVDEHTMRHFGSFRHHAYDI